MNNLCQRMANTNIADEEVVDVEVILPINEFKVLQDGILQSPEGRNF